MTVKIFDKYKKQKNSIVQTVSILALVLFSACSPFKTNIQEEETCPLIPRIVLASPPEKTDIHISPDGTMIAYIAPLLGIPNVWIKTLGNNDDHAVTNQTKQRVDSFYWAENSKEILFVQDNQGNEKWHIYKTDIKTQKTVDVTPFENVTATIIGTSKKNHDVVLIAMNKENQNLFDAYKLDIMSGKCTLVAKNPGNVDIWLADHDGRIRAAITANFDGSSTLLTRKDDNSSWVQTIAWSFEDSLVGSVPPQGSRPISFSYDGKTLYLIDSTNRNTQSLVAMDLVTGQRKTLAEDKEYDIDSTIGGRANIIFDQKTGKPSLVSFMRARKEWVALDPESKKDLESLLAIEDGDVTYVDQCADGSKWIVGFIHDDGPCVYYLYEQKTKRSAFLFYDKPVLKKYTLAKTRPISFTSRDGLTIHGYLTTPPNKSIKNLPLVLWVHGGPWWRDTWGFNKFNVWAQLFANRGYACLQVNFRGSTGYGKAFVNAGDREWGGKMHNDLIDAVNWAINEGVADENKVAIAGESYGGYSALIGATFTPDVFCCAIDLWGPTNLVSLVRSIVDFRPMGKAKWFSRVGDPEKDKEFLQSRSSIFFVDNIKIPILVVQGANDPRVKQSESEAIVAAMKTKGIPYEYLLFPGEGHGLVKPENNIKLGIAIEKMLAKHLGGRVEN